MVNSVKRSRSVSSLSGKLDGPISRDNSYYFEDGNAVFLVGNVLFKLHSSLLMRECEMFENMFTLPVKRMRSGGEDGTCDERPIVVPHIEPQPFRNFLLIFYGRPSDTDYRSLMMDATDPNNHNSSVFLKLIDIADLAHRFVAPELESWALGQLKQFACSTEKMSKYHISPEYQLKLLRYAKLALDENLTYWVRHWIRSHYVWGMDPSPAKPAFTIKSIERVREQLVRLFKIPNLRETEPALFGFTFCLLLSLGHTFWSKASLLTRQDRIILLSGQVHLTPLPESRISLQWLDAYAQKGNRVSKSRHKPCARCLITRAWDDAFGGGYRQMVYSNTPLAGISALVLLPHRRQHFADALKKISPMICSAKCQDTILKFVDRHIDGVFAQVATFWKDVE
ncbi:hypothetical protein RhiJN_11162 [Ceratobasidium sp. AG-Ba]|nr:hypothetical protein RhiJN_11162 [Ceratobasidium sp. AG-Ba]QRW11866.1 hypothetical protein RhiLY_10865 [Ceratobasidium sp. AG-Ba]